MDFDVEPLECECEDKENCTSGYQAYWAVRDSLKPTKPTISEKIKNNSLYRSLYRLFDRLANFIDISIRTLSVFVIIGLILFVVALTTYDVFGPFGESSNQSLDNDVEVVNLDKIEPLTVEDGMEFWCTDFPDDIACQGVEEQIKEYVKIWTEELCSYYPEDPYCKDIEKKEFTDTTTVQDTTTTTVLKDFYEMWEKSLKEGISLSSYEIEITENFYGLWSSKYPPFRIKEESFYEIKVAGRSCFRIYWNQGQEAFLDEIHPMAEFNEFATQVVNNQPFYSAGATYDCETSDLDVDNDYYFALHLYGIPFYYEESWWIYQSVPLSSVELHNSRVGTNRPFWDYATRVKIDTNDEFDNITNP